MNSIKERLKVLNMSQSKAARLSDVPQPSFNLIANGKLFPCPKWRQQISKVLEIPEPELFPECQHESKEE